MRHVIQAPIKGLIGVLGTVIFGAIWEVARGDQYNYNPDAVGLYNKYASDTQLVIAVSKSFGLAAALAIFWFALAQVAPPLCLVRNKKFSYMIDLYK